MVSPTSTHTFHSSTNGKPAVTTLDNLARLSGSELAELYARGTIPDSLAALDGDLVGRMLAVRGLDRGAPFHFLSSFARSARFPWAGKSFRSPSARSAGPGDETAKRGTGLNRLDLGRRGGLHRVFPFTTHFGPSVVDDKPCVILDYDQPENPPMIRAIHDEVRAVGHGLFLGPACLKRGTGRSTIVLWFAVQRPEQNARPH